MCGRFAYNLPAELLAELFGLDLPRDPPSLRYNIAPTQKIPVIVADDAGKNHLEVMRWGLIPFWTKEPGQGPLLINARCETIADKAAFRQAIRRRRCLIPASGFYEWEAVGKVKVPHYIRLRGGAPMIFAGIWETWHGPEGEVRSCAILTTEANELVAPLHDRMPVILSREALSDWLDPAVTNPELLIRLYTPYSTADMEQYLVSSQVNSARVDLPELVLPISAG